MKRTTVRADGCCSALRLPALVPSLSLGALYLRCELGMRAQNWKGSRARLGLRAACASANGAGGGALSSTFSAVNGRATRGFPCCSGPYLLQRIFNRGEHVFLWAESGLSASRSHLKFRARIRFDQEPSTSLRICQLGSGSGGNATWIATDQVRLLVDVGFSFREIGKRLDAIGERAEDLDAVLISHEHSDHVRGLPQAAKKLKIPIHLTAMTDDAIDWHKARPRREIFQAGQRLVIGDVEIDSFTVPHDAVDPVAFCFRSQGVKLGLVTDLGYMPDSVRLQIEGCQLLVLESNHDLDMLKVGPYPWFVKQRVMSRMGHLSNQAVSDFLSGGFDRGARTVVLAHLSDNNNHPAIARLFATGALDEAGARDTRVVVAAQDRPTEVFTF